MRSKYFWLVFASTVFLSLNSFAVVRTVFTNQKIMKTVNLRMGQATVLRFLEKPKKAVIGNQNYYNIEFVEGTNDVTIQPLGNVATNLFLYTEFRSYGLLLNVKAGGRYDDLVNIRWSHSAVNKRFRKRTKKPKKLPKLKGQLQNLLTFEITKAFSLGMNKTFILDVVLLNTSKTILNKDQVKMFTSKSNKPFGQIRWVWQKEKIKPSESIKVRGFLSTQDKADFSLYVQVNDIKDRVIIKKEVLSTHL